MGTPHPLTITDPVGVAEIAGRANVRPATVTKWRQRHDDFPAPAVELATGAVWEWADVEEWLSRDRPPGRPPVN